MKGRENEAQKGEAIPRTVPARNLKRFCRRPPRATRLERKRPKEGMMIFPFFFDYVIGNKEKARITPLPAEGVKNLSWLGGREEE